MEQKRVLDELKDQNSTTVGKLSIDSGVLSNLESAISSASISDLDESETRRNTKLNSMSVPLIDLDLLPEGAVQSAESSENSPALAKSKTLPRFVSKKGLMMTFASAKNVSFGWNETRLRFAEPDEDDAQGVAQDLDRDQDNLMPKCLSEKERTYLSLVRRKREELLARMQSDYRLVEEEFFEYMIEQNFANNVLFEDNESLGCSQATLNGHWELSTNDLIAKNRSSKSEAMTSWKSCEQQRQSNSLPGQKLPYRSGTGTFPTGSDEPRDPPSVLWGASKIKAHLSRTNLSEKRAASSSRGLRSSRMLRGSILGRRAVKNPTEQPRWAAFQWFRRNHEKRKPGIDDQTRKADFGARASALPAMRWSRRSSRKTISRFHDSSSIGSLFSNENAL